MEFIFYFLALLFFVPRKGPPASGNLFLWLGFSFGPGLCATLYMFEYYARINCPSTVVSNHLPWLFKSLNQIDRLKLNFFSLIFRNHPFKTSSFLDLGLAIFFKISIDCQEINFASLLCYQYKLMRKLFLIVVVYCTSLLFIDNFFFVFIKFKVKNYVIYSCNIKYI